MMSLRVTSLVEEEGADVDEADQDEAEREGGAADPDCFELNCTSLRLTVAVSMAHTYRKSGRMLEREQKNGVRSP